MRRGHLLDITRILIQNFRPIMDAEIIVTPDGVHWAEQRREDRDPSCGAACADGVVGATEADHVYLIGMAEDQIPSYQSIQKGDRSPEMEAERRNCFVAITRTKEQLTLCTARTYNGYGKKPSRFLGELGMEVPGL